MTESAANLRAAEAGAATPAEPQAASATRNPELERRVIDLWNAGYESADIQHKLSLASRNVVIGLVHRARQRGEHVLTKEEKLAISPNRKRQAISGAGISTAHNGKGNYIPRAVGSKDCVWPEGHPGDKDFKFCGNKAQVGRPYCAAHCQRAYQRRTVG